MDEIDGDLLSLAKCVVYPGATALNSVAYYILTEHRERQDFRYSCDYSFIHSNTYLPCPAMKSGRDSI